MKSIKLTLIILVFNLNILHTQTVDIPFTVSDGLYTLTDLLRVGLDTTATDGLDEHLGEYEIPPMLPGTFLAAFDLFPYTGQSILTFRDYRNAPSFPFTGTKEHTMRWSVSSSTTSLTIFYNFPIGAFANIKDPLGGVFYSQNLTDSGTFVVPYSSIISTAILTMYYSNIGGDPTPGPVFSLIPDSLNFGEVAFGQTKTLPVMITNGGYLDSLYIYNAVSSDPAFTIEPISYPVIIPALQTQIFNITYSASAGTHIDSILFIHNAPDSPGRLDVYATTYNPNPNCEAQFLSEVIITDGVNPVPRHLKFGLDSSATDGIDPHLGEIGPLPPFPPPGAFETQFFLPENNYSGTLSAYCDFRFATLPFSGQKEWRLVYQASSGAEITIYWDFPEYMNGTLQDIINGTFINVPMTGSGSFTITDPVTYNRLRMLIDFDMEVPVELVSFSASLVDYNVHLEWSTATETNNSGFEIERLQNPKIESLQNWEKIVFVSGYGTTTEPKSYSFIDENVTTGNYKYRLKQIDNDGTFTYSNEVEVVVDFAPKEFVLNQNFPNPFNPVTTISWHSPVGTHQVLKVFDVLGNEITTLVNEYKNAGIHEVEFFATDLASGIYFYRITAGSYTEIMKMILLR